MKGAATATIWRLAVAAVAAMGGIAFSRSAWPAIDGLLRLWLVVGAALSAFLLTMPTLWQWHQTNVRRALDELERRKRVILLGSCPVVLLLLCSATLLLLDAGIVNNGVMLSKAQDELSQRLIFRAPIVPVEAVRVVTSNPQQHLRCYSFDPRDRPPFDASLVNSYELTSFFKLSKFGAEQLAGLVCQRDLLSPDKRLPELWVFTEGAFVLDQRSLAHIRAWYLGIAACIWLVSILAFTRRSRPGAGRAASAIGV